MDAQALMAQFEAAQKALQAMELQLGRIEEQMIELRRANSTLDAVAEGAESTLIPIGGGVHVRATIPAGQPVVTPIGADVAADLSVEAAKEHLQARLQDAQQLFQQRSQEAENLAQQARQMAQQLQSQDA